MYFLLSDSARSEPASDPVKPVIGQWLGSFVRASSENVYCVSCPAEELWTVCQTQYAHKDTESDSCRLKVCSFRMYLSWQQIFNRILLWTVWSGRVQDSLEHCPMLIKIQTLNWNTSKYWALPTNADQFLSIPLNVDWYWEESISIGINNRILISIVYWSALANDLGILHWPDQCTRPLVIKMLSVGILILNAKLIKLFCHFENILTRTSLY